MSTLFIKNAYCCGHGEIVHRLENWCISTKTKYKISPDRNASTATYKGKTVELGPTITLAQALKELGLN